jgi:hypothetical protein
MSSAKAARHRESSSRPSAHGPLPVHPWRTFDTLFVSALVGWLAISQRWLGWSAGIAKVQANDVKAYLQISGAAPHFPKAPLGSAYTERFSIHYLVGLLHKGTGLSLITTYRVVGMIVAAGILWVAILTLRRLGLHGTFFRICLTIFVLNPYSFRYYALAPGMLADPVYELALAVCLYAAIARRTGWLLVSAFAAILARQTALTTVPVFAVWILMDPRWADMKRRLRWLLAAVLVVGPLVIYGGIRAIVSSFSHSYEPHIPKDTIFELLTKSGSTHALASHVFHTLVPVILVLGLLISGALVHSRMRPSAFRSPAFWGCLATGLVIFGETVVISPDFPGYKGNEPRLSALSLLAFTLALGVMLRHFGPGSVRHRGLLEALLMLVLAGMSLHHLYSSFGPTTSSQFVAGQVIGSFVAIVLIGRLVFGTSGGAASDPGPSPDETAGTASKLEFSRS